MKKLIILVALIASCVVQADTTEADEVRDYVQDVIAKLEEQEHIEQENDAIAQVIYGEGADSSFITRTDLTATQKRFLALGRQYYKLVIYVQQLEARIGALEAENERRKNARIEFARKAEEERKKRVAKDMMKNVIRKGKEAK